MSSQPGKEWEVTLTRARDLLGSKGYDLATEVRTQDELQGEMRRLSDIYSKRGVANILNRLNPFLTNLSSFAGSVDTFVQSSPEYSALLWGSLKVVLTMAIRFIDVLNLIVSMFEEVESNLPRLQAYQKVFKGARRMETQLSALYGHYISFCVSTIKFFSRRQCWAFIRLTWSSESNTFRDTISKLRGCKAEIEFEACAAHYEASAERHEEWKVHHKELKTLCAQILPMPREEAIRLPCRCIAFPQNQHFFPRPDISNKLDEFFGHKPHTQDQTQYESISSQNQHLREGNHDKRQTCEQPFEHQIPTLQRSLVIYGLGGVGKTQLVQDFAYRHWNNYKAILWVTADTVTKIAKEYSDMAYALGISTSPDQTTSRKALKRWLEAT
ncbi:MAG: hypothetical protein Q9214_002318, partial [Letrouitia sp. 1 TL-2023]